MNYVLSVTRVSLHRVDGCHISFCSAHFVPNVLFVVVGQTHREDGQRRCASSYPVVLLYLGTLVHAVQTSVLCHFC